MRKFRILVGQEVSSGALNEGEIVTFEQLEDWGNGIGWDGKVELWNKKMIVQIEEVKEMTLIEKIMEHFGLEEGEKFNIVGDSYNPFMFTNYGLVDCDTERRQTMLGRLIMGEKEFEKISRKSEKDLAIERAEKKIIEAQEELRKAKEMK